MDVKKYLRNWAEVYRKDLTDNIMPFWLNHGLDRENGGVYTCLDREGRLMDGTKSVLVLLPLSPITILRGGRSGWRHQEVV